MPIIPSLPFDLINGQVADANQVMGNFDEIVNDVNDNAAASGANADITSLSGLTTPLSVNQGGTGANTAPTALVSLGAAASGANADITSLSKVATIASPAGTAMAIESDTGVSVTELDGITLQQANVAPAVLTTAAVPLGQLQSLISGAIRGIAIQVFGSAGSFTYIPTTGMASAYVRAVGAGGGGATNPGGTVGSAGGGSGASCEGILTAAQVGVSVSGTVGTGGAAGNAGGATSMGTLFSLSGGLGAQYGSSGVNFPAGAGGTAGSTTSGLVFLPGSAGGIGNGAGGWGGTNPSSCGNGAPSIFGGGGQGAGNSGGGGAGAYGGGGGGGNGTGGTGGNGLIVIVEFIA